MKNKLIIGVFIVLFLAIGIIGVSGETIEGNSVYVSNGKGTIKATPHTIFQSRWVTFEVTPNTYTGDVNMLFGVDWSSLQPGGIRLVSPHNVTVNHSYTCDGLFNYTTDPKYYWCYENGTIKQEGSFDTGNIGTKTVYWSEQVEQPYKYYNRLINSIDYDYDGMNKWYYMKDIPVVSGETRTFQILLNRPFEQPEGLIKYDMAFYPSAYGSDIGQALTDNAMLVLDPWTGYESCSEDDADYIYRTSFETTRTANFTASAESCSWQNTGTTAKDGSYVLSCPTTNDREIWDNPLTDFTMEFWVRSNSAVNTYAPGYSFSGDDLPAYFTSSASALWLYYEGSDRSGGATYTSDAWYKVRFQHDITNGKGSTWVWDDTGSLHASVTNYTFTYTSGDDVIGNGGGSSASAYFDDMRFWSGVGACPVASTTDNPPTVELNQPLDNITYNTTSPISVNFSCNVTDDNIIQNISLFITDENNANFDLNETYSCGGSCGNYTQALFTQNLDIGNFTWNCEAWDNATNVSWGVNRSIELAYQDLTPPSFDHSLPNLLHQNGTNFTYDINATDPEGNFDTFGINDSSFAINDTGVLINNSALSIKSYYLNISINDTYGNTAYGQFSVIVSENGTSPPPPVATQGYINTFINGYTEGLIKFENNTGTNWTEYVQIPLSANVTGASINLTGITNYYQLGTDAEVYIPAVLGPFTQNYFNYTKKAAQTNTYVYITNGSGSFYLSTPQGCYNQNVLQYSLYSTMGIVNLSCYNGTVWNTLQYFNIGSIVFNGVLFNQSVHNISIDVGDFDDVYEWTATGDYDYSNYTSDFKTALNNALGGGSCTYGVSDGALCTIPVKFLSDKLGLLNWSELNITYDTPINITFYDSETKQLIDFEKVFFQYIGVEANNYSTTNGNIFISNIIFSNYTLRYSSNVTYPEKFYYFNYDGSNTSLALYLTNGSTASNITVNIIDDNADPLPSVIVQAWRYDVTQNAYLLDESAVTNNDGKVIMTLVKDTEYYKFIIKDNAGNIVKETAASYLYEDAYTIQVFLLSAPFSQYFKLNDITYGISFINLTHSFRYLFSDSSGEVTRGCFYVYTIDTLNGSDLFNHTCISNSSAILYVGVTPNNGTTYRGIAYVTIDSVDYYLGESWKSYQPDSVFGTIGLILAILLGIMAIFIARGSMSTSLVMFVTALTLLKILTLIQISWGYFAGLWIITIVALYFINKKEQ